MALTELELFGDGPGTTLDPEGWAPAGVTGAAKAAQRFAYFLLTPRGSVPGRPADGSDFLELATGFRSEFDLVAAFAASQSQAAASCAAAEADETDPAEKLGPTRLAGVAVAGGSATFTFAVTSAAGVAAPPLAVTVDL